MKRRSGKTWLALLCLAGCNPPLVYDPQQPIAPNILDRTEPELELRVFFAGNNFDSVVKPKGMFFFSPARCIHVASPFRVLAAATDLEGGISYLNLASPDVLPIAGSFVATPAPDSTTQVDDPASPNVTYANPGMSPGSHTVEVTYYSGGALPGRPRGFVTLEAKFNLGSVSVADLSVRARNTSVSASSASMDGYFVRPADATHPPGSPCTPPP